jgi:hypothetical protein
VRALSKCSFAGRGLDANHDDIAIRRVDAISSLGGNRTRSGGVETVVGV